MKHNIQLMHAANPEQIVSIMREIGSDEGGIALMAPKGQSLLVRLEQVNLKAANIIKQEMLSRGGDAAVHRDVSMLTKDFSTVLLVGTRRQLREFVRKCRNQPFGLKTLGAELEYVLHVEEKTWRKPVRILICRDKTLTIGERTLIMGILNVTPDSFSDGGQFVTAETALARARQMVDEGADLIDIGGESTRPGADKVDLEEELRRVVPIVKALHEAIDVPISVDTYKAEVARQALEAGANMINDVSGLRADARMAEVIAAYGCPVVLMHNREQANYEHLLSDVIRDLRESIALAHSAGVEDGQIILDPGIGFAKSHNDNIELLGSLQSIVDLGYPVLLGTSRKRVVRHTIGADVEDCVEGTAATIAFGIAQGCQMMRVHDIRAMKRVAMMSDAMMNGRKADWTE
jgi:dihydropteroate synthase